MSQSTNTSAAAGAIADVLGVVVEPQSYKNVLYLLLAFPLGIAYFAFLTIGFTLGLALSVLVVGLGILVATVIGVRLLAAFERGLANRLLGTSIARPTDVDKSGGIVGTVRGYLAASSTWRGLGFVFLKFWVGIVSFVLLVTFLGTAVELLLLPVFTDGALNVQIADWTVAESLTTTTERALAVPAGAVLAVVALHLLNAFARVNASAASSLLGPPTADDEAPADAA